MLARRRPRRPASRRSAIGRGRLAALFAGAYATGTYGGYFAASQGVLQIGIFGLLLREPLQRLNAIKNVLTTAVNAVAAAAYVVVATDRVDWRAAGLIAGGSLLGGYIGARVRPPAAVGGAADGDRAPRAGRDRGAAEPMSVLEFGFLVLAGIGAGLTGSIAGLASLISYPALLAVGLPPVTANVTNTVALVLNSVGSVSASRPELTGQRASAAAAGRGRGARRARPARRCCC